MLGRDALLPLAIASLLATQAQATCVTELLPVTGTFTDDATFSGSVNLTGASGTFKQWIPCVTVPVIGGCLPGSNLHVSLPVTGTPSTVNMAAGALLACASAALARGRRRTS